MVVLEKKATGSLMSILFYSLAALIHTTNAVLYYKGVREYDPWENERLLCQGKGEKVKS